MIAVGGTSLELGPAGEWHDEHVWDQLEPLDEAGGSGCSALFPAPSWQLELPKWAALGCGGRRATADIAAIADPRLGVAVYDSNKDSEGHKVGWRPVGGTSAGTPLIAAAFALAGGAHGVPYPAQTLYRNAAASNDGLLHDITSGTNGACERFLGRGCTAEEQAADCGSGPICVPGPGYDGPTGLGACTGSARSSRAWRSGRRLPHLPVEATPSPRKPRLNSPGSRRRSPPRRPASARPWQGRLAARRGNVHTDGLGERGTWKRAELRRRAHAAGSQLLLRSARGDDVGGAAYVPAVSASSGLQVSLVSEADRCAPCRGTR